MTALGSTCIISSMVDIEGKPRTTEAAQLYEHASELLLT